MADQTLPSLTACKLIVKLDKIVKELTRPGRKITEGDVEIVNTLWPMIVSQVGFYGGRSFHLTLEERAAYISVEHNIKIFNLLYGNQ